MENKNGQGIFYGVIGVATLVVAIIGATFAYFSAAVTTNYTNNIAGGTLDNLASSLSINVAKVDLGGNAASGDNLVPTDLRRANAGDIQNALVHKCVDNGYTGCHLYKITASSATALENAKITLDDLVYTPSTNGAAANNTDWEYTVFQTSVALGTTDFTSSDTVTLTSGANGTFDIALNDATDDVTIHDAALNSTGVVYYLMILLHDDNPNGANTEVDAQNVGGSNDATGTYSGHVSMTAAGGGKFTASFTTGV